MKTIFLEFVKESSSLLFIVLMHHNKLFLDINRNRQTRDLCWADYLTEINFMILWKWLELQGHESWLTRKWFCCCKQIKIQCNTRICTMYSFKRFPVWYFLCLTLLVVSWHNLKATFAQIAYKDYFY